MIANPILLELSARNVKLVGQEKTANILPSAMTTRRFMKPPDATTKKELLITGGVMTIGNLNIRSLPIGVVKAGTGSPGPQALRWQPRMR